MIAYIKGEVAEIEENGIILDNQNMGYRIFMPVSSFSGILRKGDAVRIYTYLHVKEDAVQLYGFLTKEDLQLFKLMLGVSGIGPKAALGILSALSADDLRFAVLSEDAASIAKAPGVGKKTAQKLILELKDKLKLEEAFESKLSNNQNRMAADGLGAAREEAVQALVALGYSNSDALRAVRDADVSADMDVETLLKAALKNL